MSDAVTTRLARDDEGRPVVVRAAPAGPAAARLRHEAARLEAARHEGVIELVSVREDGDGGVEITVRHATGRPLSDRDRLEPAAALDLGASVSATLADLHDRGVVHGAVAPDHVLVRPGGGALLSGWDVEHRRVPGPTTADDVRAVGALLAALADRISDGTEARRLRRAADLAGAGGSGEPASMRRVAAALAPEPTATRVPRDLPRPSRQALVRAGGLLTGAVLVALAAVAMSSRGTEASAPSPTAPPTSTTEPPTSTTTTTSDPPAAPTQVWPAPTPPPCPPVAAPALPADVDGDGCDDPVVVDGHVVEAAGERWAVGDDGDIVLLGDWDCDRRATVGLFRPVTGEAFVFAAWGEATVTPVAVAPTATTATVAEAGGCDRLELRDDTGAVVATS